MGMKTAPMAVMRIWAYAVILLIAFAWQNFFHDFIIIPENLTCETGAFKCSKGRPSCVSTVRVCDSLQQCSDGSDEESCGELDGHMISCFSQTQTLKFSKRKLGCVFQVYVVAILTTQMGPSHLHRTRMNTQKMLSVSTIYHCPMTPTYPLQYWVSIFMMNIHINVEVTRDMTTSRWETVILKTLHLWRNSVDVIYHHQSNRLKIICWSGKMRTAKETNAK